MRTISLIYNRGAFFRQSFMSTGGAGAFFFGATGAAVSSDGSMLGGTGEVVSSDGSLFDGTGAAVSSDGSLVGVTDEVVVPTALCSMGRGRMLAPAAAVAATVAAMSVRDVDYHQYQCRG